MKFKNLYWHQDPFLEISFAYAYSNFDKKLPLDTLEIISNTGPVLDTLALTAQSKVMN